MLAKKNLIDNLVVGCMRPCVDTSLTARTADYSIKSVKYSRVKKSLNRPTCHNPFEFKQL